MALIDPLKKLKKSGTRETILAYWELSNDPILICHSGRLEIRLRVAHQLTARTTINFSAEYESPGRDSEPQEIVLKN